MPRWEERRELGFELVANCLRTRICVLRSTRLHLLRLRRSLIYVCAQVAFVDAYVASLQPLYAKLAQQPGALDKVTRRIARAEVRLPAKQSYTPPCWPVFATP